MKRQRLHGNPRKNYSAEWRRWRKERKWTQEQMGDVLGMTRRTIINIEKGYHNPNATSRMKLRELKKKYREVQVWQ